VACARFRFLTPFFFVFLGDCGSWLFIKIANALFNKINNLFYHWHFLPFRRAELSASALLQRIRGEIPQLHPLRLASAATSKKWCPNYCLFYFDFNDEYYV